MAAASQEQRRQAARPNPPSGNAAAGKPPLRFWTTDVNRHYLEAIAERESRGNSDHGYGARNGDALGRYQFLPAALVDAKWFEPGPDGGLVPTERAAAFGVQSLEDWRRNAPAQEEAMRDFSRRNEEQATERKLWDRLGLVYQGREGQIAITPAGIAAAAHRQGAPATRKYFDKLAANGWDSKSADLNKEDLRVETRLREFQAVPYTPYTQRVRDRLRTDPENDR
ncbi:MAG: hypothetical protein NTY59_02240 [Alphaproteobacteria bacterium]|nr:hypothetical protein [Alphaproteobacteria bacterium]